MALSRVPIRLLVDREGPLVLETLPVWPLDVDKIEQRLTHAVGIMALISI